MPASSPSSRPPSTPRPGAHRTPAAGFPAPRAVRLLALLVLVAGAGLAPAGEAEAARAQMPAQKEAELRKLNARIEKVRKSVNEDVQKRDQLSVELREAELGVSTARRELDDIRAQRLVAEGRLRELEQQRLRAERELDGERVELAGELRAAYVNGRGEQLKLLLNQEDPASVGRTLAYYGYFGRARATRIRGIQDRLEHLALLGEKIEAEQARLEALEQQREQRVASLKASQEQRARAVSAIDRQIRSRDGELKRLQSQARSLEKLIDELRKAIEKAEREAAARSRTPARTPGPAPFEPLKGKLPWPVQDGKLLARFGQPRAGGSMRWQGMLIGTERGARVRAPFAGRVVYGDWLPGMGLMLVLDHGGGYMSLYGHNEELFRKVGDAVAAGDVIGAVGDTGGHAQPALYFEVRRGRTPVDPQRWLTRK